LEEERRRRRRIVDDQKSGGPIWHGKPAIGSYVIIYGLIAIVVILILVTLEYVLSTSSPIARSLMPPQARFGSTIVPYPVEILTTLAIVVVFLYKLIRLTIIWATNTYDLLPDGLYINHGLINLENTLVAPIAFSDARLIRTWILRLAARGLIIVEANDGRRFYLQYVKNPIQVQSLIRKTLARPTFRTEEKDSGLENG
jgi:hypothetical protein